MSTLSKKLLEDELGFVLSTELVLIATVGVLGLTAALTCVRDSVVGEMKDVAGAIGSLNQSYSYSGMHGCVSRRCGVTSWTAGSAFGDAQDGEEVAFACPTVPSVKRVDPVPKEQIVHPPVVEQGPLMIDEPPCPPVIKSTPYPSSVDSVPCPCETAPRVICPPAPCAPAGPICPNPCQSSVPVQVCPPTTPSVPLIW
jgi:hypothetical protein